VVARGRIAAAFCVVAAWGSACDIILDVPSSDQVKSLDEVGQILCSCGELERQGGEFVEACETGLEAKGEEGRRALAEADCDTCTELPSCYGLATGAEPEPDGEGCELAAGCGDCTTHTGCQSFSCCAAGLTFGMDVGPVAGQCCAACASCAELFPAEGDAADDRVACVDSLVPVYELALCLCTDAVWDACQQACGPVVPVADVFDRVQKCPWFYGPCRDCMLGIAGDPCREKVDACAATSPRPVGAAP
jgi:hypothetical protein